MIFFQQDICIKIVTLDFSFRHSIFTYIYYELFKNRYKDINKLWKFA